MLLLSRKIEEEIKIGDNITIKVISIRGDQVQLGIDAPRELPVHRKEIWDEIQTQKQDDQSDPEAS